MASATDRQRSRRIGRGIALQAVFEADFGQATATSVLERHIEEVGADPAAAETARTIVSVVIRERAAIDRMIGRYAPKHPVTGMARMDRSLLRCAIGEVLHSPTPTRVAIAEWVELARIYSGESIRRLLNGVLGRIAAEEIGSQPDDATAGRSPKRQP
jgi:N utilization substance protein B